jgi:CRISPR-associated protein Cas1
MIGQVIIHHGIEVTHTALERLGALGIPTTFLDPEGRVRTRLCPPWKHDAAPRIEQARVFLDSSSRLRIARRLVDAKIANSAAVLTRHSGNYPDSELNGAASRLHKLRRQARAAGPIEELMGYEGAAARLYFSVFSRMLRPLWVTFQGRNRRPPLDPVNALLSYTYAVLTHQMLARLEGVGLDPYIGFLHRVEARRPSLALDLIEPFRPVLADRLCLRLSNLNILRLEHFEDRKPQPGIFLNSSGRRAVLEAVVDWSDQCDEALGDNHPSPQSLLTREVDGFAKAAREQTLVRFQPYYLIPKDQPDA